MTLYRHTHERIWCSTYGASFTHIPSSPPDFSDWFYLSRGCDFGHDIVWVDGEVLYLVGTTGGYNFEFECPFPGTSYCETTFAPLLDGADDFDGMIARFDLRDVNIGIQEAGLLNGSMLVHPSPTNGQLYLRAPAWAPPGTLLHVYDATGRMVMTWPLIPDKALSVEHFASGTYTLVLRNRQTGQVAQGRFIKL